MQGNPCVYFTPWTCAMPIKFNLLESGSWVCWATTSDGVFNASFQFSGDSFSTNGKTIDPTELKISVDINNFPYADKTDAIRLALLVNGMAKVSYQSRDTSGTNKKISTGGSSFK